MMKGNNFGTPMEAYELYRAGVITLRKTLLKDENGVTYRIMRFDNHCGVLSMFLEFPDGSHQPLKERHIRSMKLKLVVSEGVKREDWIDPA